MLMDGNPKLHLADRVRGSILGGALGDAIGARAEFLSIESIRAEFGPKGITGPVPAYGVPLPITDDTQMNLFTTEAMIRSWVRGTLKGIGPDWVAVTDHAYSRWLRTQDGKSIRWDFQHWGEHDGWLFTERDLHQQRAPGRTCLSALSKPEAGRIGQPINNSKG